MLISELSILCTSLHESYRFPCNSLAHSVPVHLLLKLSGRMTFHSVWKDLFSSGWERSILAKKFKAAKDCNSPNGQKFGDQEYFYRRNILAPKNADKQVVEINMVCRNRFGGTCGMLQKPHVF